MICNEIAAWILFSLAIFLGILGLREMIKENRRQEKMFNEFERRFKAFVETLENKED